MIEITAAAQDYFQRLLAQQDEQGLGLRIEVNQPGTPLAACDLQFCPESERRQDDVVVNYPGFDLCVAAGSRAWLEQAEIDFEPDATGGQLSIRAPGIKGTEPPVSASLDQRVEWLLDSEINPSLAAHGGRVRLVEITLHKEVVLQFGGGCQGCGMADVTLKQGIEQTLRSRIPEIAAVLDATDHRSGRNPYYTPGTAGPSAV